MKELMFLRLHGVYGGSERERHSGEIDISWFTWDDKPHMGPVGIGPGKTVRKDLTVFKPPDKSSSELYVASETGRNFRTGALTIEEISGSGDLLRSVALEFESVLVGSFSVNGPVETIKLTFGQLEIKHFEKKK